MKISRLMLASIGLTLLAIVFIEVNAEPMGRIFWHLLTVYDLPAAWLMVAMLLAVHWIDRYYDGDGAWVECLVLGIERHRYAITLALWTVLCVASLFVYRNHPLSMDEYAAVFQAKIFAAGAMSGHFPPELLDALIPRGFQNQFLMVNRHTGAVFSAYWPGFSLLLTPFTVLGIPWACNPTLVAASFLLIGRIARELAVTPACAGWAMLLALASPAFVTNGITYYSMPAHLLLNLTFAWLLLVVSPWRLFLAGLVGGYALVLHNPFPHLVFALPWIAWLAIRREHRLRNLACLVSGYLPVVAVLGAGWSLWQRDLLAVGITVTNAAGASMVAPSHAERAMALLREFLRTLQLPDELILYARLGGLAKLWLWASPMLLLFAWWGARGERRMPIRLMGASALFTFFAYFSIRFDQGHGWGYRYFHSAWGVLPVLAARGVTKLVAAEGVIALRRVGMLTLMSLLAANGLRLAQMGSFMGEHLAQFPPRVESNRTIVLHNGRGYYAKDLIQNDPWLRGNQLVFYALRPGDRQKILDHFSTAKGMVSNRYGETYFWSGPEP